ncbi:ATP-binding cassette domain-containing protein, partial [candidate division KSB3 bacterium]|nr:ATP-binding cassette domain-containing protein [candidate division KSB3 bacterium]MBD3327647.1 ATP-binding cassette domain-containing protein [candidate division KSB3 bacterium]
MSRRREEITGLKKGLARERCFGLHLRFRACPNSFPGLAYEASNGSNDMSRGREPMTTDAQHSPVLEVRNVSKSFGKVQALQDVSLKIYRGDVLGLLGDNGAGKSTLIKAISGNHRPDQGEIYLNGQKVSFNNPAEAHAAGVETVYQNSPVCENATVSANFFIGRELCGTIPGFRLLKERAMQNETRHVLSEIGVHVPS